ncbi:9211_t:CDS:2, partial [Racocetra fulgida]
MDSVENITVFQECKVIKNIEKDINEETNIDEETDGDDIKIPRSLLLNINYDTFPEPSYNPYKTCVDIVDELNEKSIDLSFKRQVEEGILGDVY